MIESKVRLSLLVPGARMLSQQEAENKPEDSYNDNIIFLKYTKGKGKYQKVITQTISFKTRKQKFIKQNINIGLEAYNYMLTTPTSPKFNKIIRDKTGRTTTVWKAMTINDRLKYHFDLIAYDLKAASYNFEIIED